MREARQPVVIDGLAVAIKAYYLYVDDNLSARIADASLVLAAEALTSAYELIRWTARAYRGRSWPTARLRDRGRRLAVRTHRDRRHRAAADQSVCSYDRESGSLPGRHRHVGAGDVLVERIDNAYAQSHGGTLTIDSETGVGTRVTVRFPPGPHMWAG